MSGGGPPTAPKAERPEGIKAHRPTIALLAKRDLARIVRPPSVTALRRSVARGKKAENRCHAP